MTPRPLGGDHGSMIHLMAIVGVFVASATKGPPPGGKHDVPVMIGQVREATDEERKRWKQECDTGVMSSCYHLGFSENERGNRAEGRALFLKACDGRHGPTCYLLGLGKKNEGKEAEAREFFRKACDLGNTLGCFNIEASSLQAK